MFISKMVKYLQTIYLRLEQVSCFSHSKDKTVYRGCLSENSAMSSKCKHDNNCIKCVASGCNEMPKVRRSLLSCVQCNKSKECGFGQDEGEAIPCKNEVTIGSTETCFTNFNSGDLSLLFRAYVIIRIVAHFFQLLIQDEGWAERGCTIGIHMNFDANSHYTGICSKSGCNNNNVLHSYCVSCIGGLKDECATLKYPENFIKKCNGTYSYDQRGCYTLIKSK